MRILVLNYEFPPVGGGGGRASAALSAALAERGHELRVFTSRVSDLSSSEQMNGYRVERVLTGRSSRFQASFFSMAAYVVGGLLPALRLARSWKPEVIHAHFAVPTGALAFRLSKLTGIPYVLTAHLGDVPGGVPEKTERWFRHVYRFTPPIWNRAAKVVAVSEYTRDLAQKHYDVEIQVIPNGVQLPPENKLVNDVSTPPRLIFAGRFQPQKNLVLLVDLLARVQDLKWQCELLGDGPDRDRVSKKIKQHELGNRIELKGWVDGSTVDERLLISDLLLLPSLSEGLPVIVVQALASGVAVVASRTGGLSELVEPDVNGRLCIVDDIECFERALRWCLEDSVRLTNLKRASRRMAQRYDIAAIAATYEAILQEAALSEN